jgi:flavin reductase (DIM6/NTAB) family NADH-FMN oxidoreductase RutF
MKSELKAKNCLCPLPVTLVGANVNGKPNFLTIAFVGVVDYMNISIAVGKNQYTNPGIRENGTFSVNMPSPKLVKETDYCGLVSGKDVDKGCLFETFYGKLETAPMIVECPVNMECKLIQTIDMPKHDVFIGEIFEAYGDDEILKDGKVDAEKFEPILYLIFDTNYWKLGKSFALAWNVGKELKGEQA